MSEPRVGEIALNGLWRNNPALVQLLGLCPLLAVSGSVVNALGMGLATAIVLMGTNTLVSLVRNVVPDTIRLPAFVLIIAGAVTLVELLMQAFAYGLYEVLGIFLPLITTNCVVLGRAEAFASKHPVPLAALEGLMMGLGFSAVLVVLGALRELLGNGTLFADMQLLFGPVAADWVIRPFGEYRHFLLAVLPPGAFLFTGLLIALKNGIDAQLKARAEAARAPQAAPGSKRVRVTGQHQLNAAKRREIFRRLQAANPAPTTELDFGTPVRAAGRGDPLGAGHRRQRQQGHAQALPGGEHARGDTRARRGRAEALHPPYRPVQQQGEERDRHLRAADRAPRLAGAGRAQGTRSATRRGPQDRQRDPQHRLRRADDGRRHAHLPPRQPHPPRPRQDGARGRGQAC